MWGTCCVVSLHSQPTLLAYPDISIDIKGRLLRGHITIILLLAQLFMQLGIRSDKLNEVEV